MQLSNTKSVRRNAKSFVIECRTSKQFVEALHRIEAGGFRWWRINALPPSLHGGLYHIHTNFNPEQLV